MISHLILSYCLTGDYLAEPAGVGLFDLILAAFLSRRANSFGSLSFLATVLVIASCSSSLSIYLPRFSSFSLLSALILSLYMFICS